MSDTTITATLCAAQILADRLAAALISNLTEGISRKHLNAAMHSAFGNSQSWSQRQSFDALELAQVMLLKQDGLLRCSKPEARLVQYQKLSSLLPTATVRSEDQIRLQQFSTPLPLAFAAAQVAHISAVDVVLEPSAGIGLLAVQAFAKHAKLILNEFYPVRAAFLQALFKDVFVSQHDGAVLHDLLDPSIAPTVILMNPPFSIDVHGADDRYTAARHCASALQRLAPGGRCIAIMPGWFEPAGIYVRSFATLTENACLRANLKLPANIFAKHGTSVDVRLMVFDKGPCADAPMVQNIASLETLLEIAARLPRLAWTTDAATPVPVVARPAMNRSLAFLSRPKVVANSIVKSAVASKPTPVAAPLAYTVLDVPREAEAPVGQYQPYRLSCIDIPDASDHVTPMVESIAMASVAMPRPRYQPLLPAHLVRHTILSAPQLETVIYAGDAHDRYLANRYVCSRDGLRLELNESGARYRTGFMLGDGTGCGKGRQGAAIILDNWLKGRKRALWISMSSALIEDARRDWMSIGGIGLDIQAQDQWKLGSPITMGEGILFTTYATLRSVRDGASRLDQLLAWLGGDFDGVILFDESHAMGNAAPPANEHHKVKGSAQGVAGVTLQNRLPAARIVYVSATGATKIENLAYAQRLDLWGPHTAFASREIFVAELTAGGIAALELVARDLKAQGLYMARALSYTGVEYEMLEHDLTPDQIAEYDAYCEAWSIIHRNLTKVLESTNVMDAHSGKTLNAAAKGSALSLFESTKQRFFSQLLNGAKVATLINAIKTDLAEDRAVVVQLVSTAEAMLGRRLQQLADSERAELNIDLSPREYVIDYLQTAFPTAMMEIVSDDDGEKRSVPALDSKGHPLISKDAVRRRDALIEHLCALPPVPVALDAIIRAFGYAKVAEVTGRTRRLRHWSDGKQTVERRPRGANVTEAQAFMDGQKLVLLFSDAGGTGRSYHADMNARNRKRRVHYLLEPGWRADRAIQGLGRTHRTNQASAPLFRPVITDCKGERRFISTIALRLDSLGAITRGQRQTGGQNLFNPADNLESDIARESMVRWFSLVHDGKIACISITEFEKRTGLSLTVEGALRIDLPPIHRFLNRLLALPIQLQNDIFESFEAVIAARTAAAIEAGTLDRGVEELEAESVIIRSDQLLRTDPVSGAETRLLDIAITRKRWTQSFDQAIESLAGRDVKPMINTKSKRVCLMRPGFALLDDDGVLHQRLTLVRPIGSEDMSAQSMPDTNWKVCDLEVVRSSWEAEVVEAMNDPLKLDFHMVTGAILPVWHLLKGTRPTVYRLTPPGGHPMLGRVVQAKDLPKLTSALGVTSSVKLTNVQILKAIMTDRETFTFRGLDTIRLKRSLVNGEARLEIIGVHAARLPLYKAQSCFTEIIQYQTRLFASLEKAGDVIAFIMENHQLEPDLAKAA
jgi:predicted RNA methylase